MADRKKLATDAGSTEEMQPGTGAKRRPAPQQGPPPMMAPPPPPPMPMRPMQSPAPASLVAPQEQMGYNGGQAGGEDQIALLLKKLLGGGL